MLTERHSAFQWRFFFILDRSIKGISSPCEKAAAEIEPWEMVKKIMKGNTGHANRRDVKRQVMPDHGKSSDIP
jgi:hypothetical protein